MELQQLEVMQPLKYLLNYTFLKKDILTAMQLTLCLLGHKLNWPLDNILFQSNRNCLSLVSVVLGPQLEQCKCPKKEAGIRKSWASHYDLAHCCLLFEPVYVSSYQWVPSLCSHLSTLSFLHLLNGRFSSYQSFLDLLNEMNDYAGQRELIAENMMMSICIDLTKYLQELKQERKTVSSTWNGSTVHCVMLVIVHIWCKNKLNLACLHWSFCFKHSVQAP